MSIVSVPGELPAPLAPAKTSVGKAGGFAGRDCWPTCWPWGTRPSSAPPISWSDSAGPVLQQRGPGRVCPGLHGSHAVQRAAGSVDLEPLHGLQPPDGRAGAAPVRRQRADPCTAADGRGRPGAGAGDGRTGSEGPAPDNAGPGAVSAMIPLLLLREFCRRFGHDAVLDGRGVPARCGGGRAAWFRPWRRWRSGGGLTAVTAHLAAGLAWVWRAVAGCCWPGAVFRVRRQRLLGDWQLNWSRAAGCLAGS